MYESIYELVDTWEIRLQAAKDRGDKEVVAILSVCIDELNLALPLDRTYDKEMTPVR